MEKKLFCNLILLGKNLLHDSINYFTNYHQIRIEERSAKERLIFFWLKTYNFQSL